MKFLITIMFSLCIISILEATVHTVSNDPGNTAQYTSIQTAHDAANNGDTIYIYGSPFPYDQLGLQKQLTLIGNGYNPTDQKINAYPTICGGFYFSVITAGGSLVSSPSGSNFIGLDFGGIQTPANTGYNNITIERCKIANLWTPYTSSNWLVKNNVIHSISFGASSQNITLENNIITYGIYAPVNPSNNCNLYNNTIILSYVGQSGLNDLNFYNNIFIQTDWATIGADLNNCYFENNLSFNSFNTEIPVGQNGNTGTGNLAGNNDPLLVNYDILGWGTDPIDEEDYHLQASSPAKNAGTDGTDLGIYGGTAPWPDTEGYTGESTLPKHYDMELKNPILYPNQTLQLQLNVKKRN